jgi:hypothetical protein
VCQQGHQLDTAGLLVRKTGLHDWTGAGSSCCVGKRMCDACWAKLDKTRRSKHESLYPSGKWANAIEGDALALLTSMELQRPTGWLSKGPIREAVVRLHGAQEAAA